MFPDMENQILAEALEDYSDDLSSAINALNELRLEPVEGCNSGLASEENPNTGKDHAQESLDGAEWVDLLVKEMQTSASIDDAKSRAARILENFHKENAVLKRGIGALLKENAILKRAVAIQHERQKECDEKNQQGLQLVAQYQEQLRTLEMNNYALTLHLSQAHAPQNNSLHRKFNPDVF